MKILKSIIIIPINIIKITVKGFNYILYTIRCGFDYILITITRGFYYYFISFFKLLKRLFKSDSKILNKIINTLEIRKNQPNLLLLKFVYILFIYIVLCIVFFKPNNSVDLKKEKANIKEEDKIEIKDENDINNNDNSDSKINDFHKYNLKEKNLFKRYGSTKLEDVDLNYFKKINTDTISWISVDGTNINYPVVQTDNNEYYLEHSFNKEYKKSGWVFMDYRNNKNMTDKNTIFYGHNLYNKTSFGSLSNVFTVDWVSNSNGLIIIIADNKKYTYKIFSAYIIEAESYYLQTEFSSERNYQEFLNVIASRSIINLNENVSVSDKLITLSTCSEDNLNRKVIHAKLIS